jgi:hypothetical protein
MIIAHEARRHIRSRKRFRAAVAFLIAVFAEVHQRIRRVARMYWTAAEWRRRWTRIVRSS